MNVLNVLIIDGAKLFLIKSINCVLDTALIAIYDMKKYMILFQRMNFK